MRKGLRTLFLIVLFALAGLAGCGTDSVTTESPDVTTSAPAPVQSLPDPDCHGPTTVPGGTLPQPQCGFPDEPPATASTIPISPWECLEEDYPILIAATSWEPFVQPPDPIPACGFDLADSGSPPILIPTEPIDGLPSETSLGLNATRQPGGLFWHSRVALPASNDPLVEIRATTVGVYPDEERGQWRSEQLARVCGTVDRQPVTIRGADGCNTGSTYAWIVNDTVYELVVRLDHTPAAVIEWLDTWTVAS